MSDKLCVQFGSGGNQLDGWINHDIEMDITRPDLFPYEDGTVDMILAEHVVEHVTAPEMFRFFQKCHRMLKKGGQLLVCVPILDRVWTVNGPEAAIDLIVNHGHQQILSEHTLRQAIELSGFVGVTVLARSPLYGHYRIIGEALDDLETLRMGAVK